MVLTFNVSGQTIRKQLSAETPRRGSSDYLRLRFVFSEDWQALRKVLYIRCGDYSTPIDLTEDTVTVPAYYTQQPSFEVTLLGTLGERRVPTDVVTVALAESNELWEAEAPVPRPGWVEELMELDGHPPVPAENGTWLVWDRETGGYEDSGLPARGERGEVGPVGPRGDDGLPAALTPEGAALTLSLPNNTDVLCSEPLTALTVTGFDPAPAGKAGLWSIRFRTAAETAVTLPEDILWAGAAPDFTGGKLYWLAFSPLESGCLGVWAAL